MSSDSLSPLQFQIIQLCDDHEERERFNKNFKQCIVFEKYFIKFDSHLSIDSEYATQQYIFKFSLAEGNPSAPRVPKIYDYFTPDNRMGYLVMEYIQASSTLPRDVLEKVANALQWLRGLPAPSDAAIGSVAGRDAPYMLFRGFMAPMAFSGIEAMERYMNKALDPCRKFITPDYISFNNERLVFTQSDMHEGNFFLDTEEKMCLIDFGSVALLLESFGDYALAGWDPFIKKVADCLNWPTHNHKSMGRALEFLQMMSDETLGLNEDGFPKERQ